MERLNTEEITVKRRTLLSGTAGLLAVPAVIRRANAGTVVGVNNTEIKIGHTVPYSGPASAYGAIGKGHIAFWKMINAKGGVNGRMVNFISLDDGYVPSRTVEQTRRLVEQDEVACIFNSLGTPAISAIQKYLNGKKVPCLFVATGADKWGDYEHFPWMMGWAPSYQTEAQVYARHIALNKPDAKVALIFQNDDFGKDYPIGLKSVWGDNYKKFIVKELTYEVTDATIDSQASSLRDSGADTLITVCTPKFAAQMIRKVADLNWKPLHYLSNVSASAGSVINPAGPEKAIGIITSSYGKDPTDPMWNNDPGMNEWRAFMKANLPDADMADAGYVYSYGACLTMLGVLKQCGDDLSRENLMKQAASIKNLIIPTLIPGVVLNTSATNYHPMRQMHLTKWTGKSFELFGDIIDTSH
jgi:branched-chain amino acid transport system substrate-binding protein